MDRNAEDWLNAGALSRSLSARRAWIEIHNGGILRLLACVALRKESVDRNIPALGRGLSLIMSLSARRAWIEIFVLYH